MNELKTAKLGFFGMAALCVAQAAWAYSVLPPRVASHFDASGAANAWASKGFFLGLNAAVVALVGVLLPYAAFSARRRDDSRINLPNKEYWLAPERRDRTFDTVAARMLWFGAGTYALLFDVFRQTVRFNLGYAIRLEHPARSLALYVAFAAIWLAAFRHRFAKTS